MTFETRSSGAAATRTRFRTQGVPALLAVLAFGVALTFTACGGDAAGQGGPGGPEGEAPPPPQVGVVQPVEQLVTDWDQITGRLSAVETVEVRPRVTGYVERVHFEEGALVDRGDLLFTLDPRTFRAELQELDARREQARVELELAQTELARVEDLIEVKAVSQEELDQRKQRVATARAELAAAEADKTSANLDLSFTRVTAPVSGRVGQALVTEGNLVTGGSGSATVLTTVVSLDPMYLYLPLDERAALRYLKTLQAGGASSVPVEMQLADETGYPRRGQLDFVDNRVDESTGTLMVRARFPNPEGELRPGMYGEARLRASEPRRALLVPEKALQVDQTQEFLLIVGPDDTVERRVVQTGRVIDGLQVIVSGLAPGERVVVEGLQAAQPGAPVTPQPAEGAPSQAASAPPGGGPDTGAAGDTDAPEAAGDEASP